MHKTELEKENITERPNTFWYRVYLSVIVFAVLVIALLAFFSFYFSK